MNCCDFLYNVKKEYLDNEALIDGESGKRYTFRSLQEKVRNLAGYVIGKGYSPGATIATHLYNSAEAVISHLAIQYAGFVTCFVDPLFKPDELLYYLEDSGAVCLFTHLNCEAVKAPADRELDIVNASELEQLYENQTNPHVMAEPFNRPENDYALLIYTSGSTSKPKGVMQKPISYYTNLRIQKEIGYTYLPEDRLVCFVPFSHGYGSIYILGAALYYGAAVVMMRSFNPQKIARLIESEKITHLFGVPTHFIQLLRYDFLYDSIRKLKAAFCAAAPLNHEVANEWKEKIGFHLDEGFGLIETSTLVTFRKDCLPIPPGSIGIAASNICKVEVADQYGNEVPAGVIGELRVQGDNVMLGYLNRPLDNEKKLRDGWFYTGDFGYRSNGQFVLAGRRTEFINVAGIKVSPIDVEAVLNRNDCVVESAVVGAADKVYGEVVKAFVMLKQGGNITERELIRFASERLSNFSVPRYITFIDKFPRNNLGKIDKNILTKMD